MSGTHRSGGWTSVGTTAERTESHVDGLRALVLATIVVASTVGGVATLSGPTSAAANEAPEIVRTAEYDGNIELTFSDGVVQNNTANGAGTSGMGDQLNEHNFTVYVDGTAYDDVGDFDVRYSSGTDPNGAGEDVTVTLVPTDSWGNLHPDQNVTVHVGAVQADAAGGPVTKPGNESVAVTGPELASGGPYDTRRSALTVEQGAVVALRGSPGESVSVTRVGGSIEFAGSLGNSTVRPVNTSGYNTGASYRADFGGGADQYFNVTEPTDISFGQATYSEQRGDVAAVDLSVPTGGTVTVTVGSVGENNWAQNVTVADGDGNGNVTLEFNTYTAGASDNTNANGTPYTVYSVADPADSVTNVAPAAGPFDPATPAGGMLAADDYSLRVVGGTVPASEVAGDPDATATLSLTGRSTDALTNYAAPEARAADLDSAADVTALRANGNVTETADIAEGDLLVTSVEASGLQGVLRNRTATNAANVTAAFLDERAAAGDSAFDARITQTNPGANVDAYDATLAPNNTAVVPDPANDTYWVVVDTAEVPEFGAGDDLRTNVTMRSESSLVGGADETVTDEWSLVERSATLETNADIDGDGSNDEITVRNAAHQTINGTTTAAPGAELTVRARGTDSDAPFITPIDATVESNGSFTATGDFTDRDAGTNFSVEVRYGGDTISAVVDGRIVDAPDPTVGPPGVDSAVEYGPGTVEVVFNATVQDHDGNDLTDGGGDDVEVFLDGTSYGTVPVQRHDTDGDQDRIVVALDDALDDSLLDDAGLEPSRNLTLALDVEHEENPGATEVTTTERVPLSATTLRETEGQDPADESRSVRVYHGAPITLWNDADGTEFDTDWQIIEKGIVGTTGPMSQVVRLDTGGSTTLDSGEEYRVEFDDGDRRWIDVVDLDLAADPTDTDLAESDTLTVDVTANRGGEPVTATLLDADDEAVDATVATLEGDGTVAVTFDEQDADGSPYTVEVVDNGTGITATTGEISVAGDDATDGEGSDDGDDSGGSGGSGSSGGSTTTVIRDIDDETPAKTHDAAVIREHYTTGGGVPVYAERGSPPWFGADGDVVTFSDAAPVDRIAFAEEVSGDAAVVEYARLPIAVEAVPGQPLRAFRMSVPDAAEGMDATVEGRVPTSLLEETGVSEGDLSLLAYDDGDWDPVDASVGSGDDAVIVEGDPGDATFLAVAAVGEPDAVANVAPTTVEPGQAVTLDAGDSTADFGEVSEYDWSVGDRRLSGKTATVVLSEPGEHEVELTVTTDAGETAAATATVTVRSDADDADEPADTADGESPGPSTAERTTDGRGPGFGVVVTVLAVALLGLRRR